MYIDIVPNRNSPPAVLLRESYREGGKAKKRTLANLSKLPMEKVELLRRVLRGDKLIAPGELLEVERSLPHGHVEAVLGTIRRLGLGGMISSRPCRERDLVVAMVAERLIHPCSKLATTRLWHATTLAGELGVEDAGEDELYEAMDWLHRRQGLIEKKLARRRLAEGDLNRGQAPIFSERCNIHCNIYVFILFVLPGCAGRRRRPTIRSILSTNPSLPTGLPRCVLSRSLSTASFSLACVSRSRQSPLPTVSSQPVRSTRPAPSSPSTCARAKRRKRLTEERLPVHSFQSLMAELGTICKNSTRFPDDPTLAPFHLPTKRTPLQDRAFELLGL